MQYISIWRGVVSRRSIPSNDGRVMADDDDDDNYDDDDNNNNDDNDSNGNDNNNNDPTAVQQRQQQWRWSDGGNGDAPPAVMTKGWRQRREVL